ncbi:hypothetical protein [Paracidovorax oryzae]|uniref:hypothetical protein n=1 Tax=Paracidovorax oryzae TaxID=862720 RepID=UPI0035CF1674
MTTFSVSINTQSRWPDGKPEKSEPLPDGRIRHHMPDGRKLTVPAEAGYRIDYLSTWVGSEEGETYPVNVTFAGLSAVAGFVEVWNYDIGQMRSYGFHKIVLITDIKTGETHTGADLCKQLGGVMRA